MGCPTNCSGQATYSTWSATSRSRENDQIKSALDEIDRRAEGTLARARNEFGICLGAAFSVAAAALAFDRHDSQASQFAGALCVASTCGILCLFDYLFHRACREVVADIRERHQVLQGLCLEYRNRLGFQPPLALVRSTQLDLVWYGIACLLVLGCLTVGLISWLVPVLRSSAASPLPFAANAILIVAPLWLSVARRVARNQFQATKDLKCASAAVEDQIFRNELSRTIQAQLPRIEALRSTCAAIALTLSGTRSSVGR